MLSPQPKRNRIPSPPSIIPISEVIIEDPQNMQENMEDNQLEDEIVINGSIFADEKPPILNPIHPPRIGPTIPSPDPLSNCAAPISVPPENTKPAEQKNRLKKWNQKKLETRNKKIREKLPL